MITDLIAGLVIFALAGFILGFVVGVKLGVKRA